MSNEEINKRIAREVGYYVIQDDSGSGFRLCHPTSTTIRYSWRDYEAEAWADCDDYCNDLNAMHEAEKMLDNTLWWKYVDELTKICGAGVALCISATAQQRAEAFLKTINQWTE
jgi:hypothetical protein